MQAATIRGVVVTESEFDEVMLALGHAVYAAQLYEGNLATLLIALNVSKGVQGRFPDEASIRTWLAKVDRLPLGQIKGQIALLNLLPEHMLSNIEEVNRARIEVVHHFTNKWAHRLEDALVRSETIKYLDACQCLFLAEALELQAGLERMNAVGVLDPESS